MTRYFAILICATVFSSCKTYTVTTENLREQLAASAGLKKVVINNPLSYGNLTYDANQLKKITVTNKDGGQESLENSPSLEMRVTLTNKKRYHFYFDTVVIQNDTLFGGRSRFINSLTRRIPFDSIQKIEIQDGGKKFNYQ